MEIVPAPLAKRAGSGESEKKVWQKWRKDFSIKENEWRVRSTAFRECNLKNIHPYFFCRSDPGGVSWERKLGYNVLRESRAKHEYTIMMAVHLNMIFHIMLGTSGEFANSMIRMNSNEARAVRSLTIVSVSPFVYSLSPSTTSSCPSSNLQVVRAVESL
uniref:Uncharacterized protein n=1 Tax=Trichogramma kaykai TaxID=54128 RepID=A0ABD2W1K8_9HYME